MNTLIWVFDFSKKTQQASEDIQVEVFEAQNKYTKAGLFSGPLRRPILNDEYDNQILRQLLRMEAISQIGNNKFILLPASIAEFISMLSKANIDTVYCRLKDNKLHHVRYIKYSDSDITYFDAQASTLYYNCKKSYYNYETTTITINPKTCLYLSQEDKTIRGYLCFKYDDVELNSNSSLEIIRTSSGSFLRNLQYENIVNNRLLDLGAKKSLRNELSFNKKTFFSDILDKLRSSEIMLFWGKEAKPISRATISGSLSYNIDWFSFSGTVKDDGHDYLLSDLLRGRTNKNYVELNGKILFLPSSIASISTAKGNGEQIHLEPHKFLPIYQVAQDFHIKPQQYLRHFLDFSNCVYTLPQHLSSVLKDYQRIGVQWILTLYKNHFGGCLADDMGLGKTLQAISFLCCNERSHDRAVLIVVPKILLYNWQSEFNKFAPAEKVTVLHGHFADEKLFPDSSAIFITTYETLHRHQADFQKISYDTVILDESQSIKNFRTQRYQAVKELQRRFTLALSGTPLENNVEELWALIQLLTPNLLGSHADFMKKFGDAGENTERALYLKKLIAPFVLRRTKQNVLTELPSKTDITLTCEMDVAQQQLYEKILIAARNEISSKPSRFIIKDNAVILRALLYLREVCTDPLLLPLELRSENPSSSCKLEVFYQYSQRILQNFDKLIVFSQFPSTLKRLEAWCKRQGWKTFYIDGKTNHRDSIVRDFESSDSGVFFISLKAGGVGLNLVSCQYVILYEPWWNPAVEQQAADRIYRIGQEKPVFIYHFIVKDSIEEKMLELQQKKSALFTTMMDELDVPSKISIDDLRQLLL
jgi:SNF2 family DNA or RNA helicase